MTRALTTETRSKISCISHIENKAYQIPDTLTAGFMNFKASVKLLLDGIVVV